MRARILLWVIAASLGARAQAASLVNTVSSMLQSAQFQKALSGS